MLKSYTWKASLVLAGTAVCSLCFILSGPCSRCILQCCFPAFVPEVKRNGDLAISLSVLILFFFKGKDVLTPNIFNTTLSTLPLSFFKPPLNLRYRSGWQDSFNYPPSECSSLPRCFQQTPPQRFCVHKLHVQIEASNENKMSKNPPLKKLITNTPGASHTPH